MPSVSELSLINMDWPGSLLQCNSEFLQMQPGDRLDVLMDDPEIAKTLMLVVGRKEDLSAMMNEQNGQIRISVQKK